MNLFKIRKNSFFLIVILSLSACKKHDASPPAAPSPEKVAPAVATAPAPAGAQGSAVFSVEQVPMSTAQLPPFPLLSFPDALPENSRNEQDVAFEEAYVVAGATLRKIAGRMSTRFFSNSEAGLSASAARRNYQQALEALGAVKVNQVKPTDAQLVGKEGGDVEKLLAKLRLMDAGPRFDDRGIASYDVYLIRHAQGNTWVTVTTDEGGLSTFLMTLQEKPLRQSVTALTAERFAATLKADGHLALYLSFDTDQTTLRPDSGAVMGEVVKLMQADPALRLRIEGHTDNVGAEAHNQALSAGRASSVKTALVALKIDAARMETKGFGATHPVADNTSEAGRDKNRRVELVKL